jgi:excisionase family DNA binding protein
MNDQLPAGDVYKPREVANILKMGLSTIYEMIETRQIGVIRHGRAVRIRRTDLEKWMQDHYQPAKA